MTLLGRIAAAAAALFLLVTALVTVPVASAQPLPQAEPMVHLNITSLSPRVVTESAEELTVSARITNIADVPIHDLKARIQLGAPQASSVELGQALRGTAQVEFQRTEFEHFQPILQPGKSVDLTLTASLRGELGGLLLAEPGVYPMLVNVNGTPEASGEARLAAMNLLLPVRSSPGGEPPETPAEPQPLSVLWPIAAKPRVVNEPTRGSVVLADDKLADELRPGGRLYALVDTADQVRVDDPELFDALCFGIDPDLLATVDAMSKGYRVRQGLHVVKGSGRADAKAWLNTLRTVAEDHCVVPTAYARADVPALATRTPDLATLAASREGVIEDVLGVQPLSGAIWSTGALTDDALQALSKAEKHLVITNAGDLDADHPPAAPQSVATGDDPEGGGIQALPYDELGALALTPHSASEQLGFPATVAADDPSIAAQNAVATVLFRAQDSNGPMLLAPPQVWRASATEMRWLLTGLTDLTDGGVIEPMSMAALQEEGDGGSVQPALGATGSARLSGRAAADIAAADATVHDFAEAIDFDPSANEQVEPEQVTDPMYSALLRASSTEFQRSASARGAAVEAAQKQIAGVLAQVAVSDPERTISLASGSSPIPVLIANRLPVRVTVQVALSSTSGLRPADVPEIEVPAGRSRNVRVPAEALRAGRFTVDVKLTTPGGTELGTPTRFELASTEYGLITVIVTATAGGALLLLAGRRIYRRLKGNGATPRPQE